MDEDNERLREDLVDRMREIRAMEIERVAQRDVSERVEAMRRSGKQATIFMALVGLFLMIFNAIMLANIGVDVVWANPVLVCLFSFSYLSGVFLGLYTIMQVRQNQRSATRYAIYLREDADNASELRRLESFLERLNEEEARRNHGGSLGS